MTNVMFNIALELRNMKDKMKSLRVTELMIRERSEAHDPLVKDLHLQLNGLENFIDKAISIGKGKE